MTSDAKWDVNKYREEHECDEHWLLRKAFMERWKDDYSEERLVCLARVFANVEFLGCRYPQPVMVEISRLSRDVAQKYRNIKKTKLQRTFVSASDAAEDRARGVKREGGIIKGGPTKSMKIDFVREGMGGIVNEEQAVVEVVCEKKDEIETVISEVIPKEYLNEFANMKCLNLNLFSENMFKTEYGRFVLIVRPWVTKYSNINMSAQVCHLPMVGQYESHKFSIYLNNILLAEASDITKAGARHKAEDIAWEVLIKKVICLYESEKWIAHGDRISMNDVSNKKHEFGTPIENNVAMKMMKLMGWKGGGLGADSQGIEEPVKPHLQMVNRAGLGSNSNIHQLRRAGQELMKRFIGSDTFDVDLVFSSQFSKDERAMLHQCAKRFGLASKSYGADEDRFLVVKKRLDPFSLVRAVIEKGGETPKHKIFLPEALKHCR